jgi:hypothetical protein
MVGSFDDARTKLTLGHMKMRHLQLSELLVLLLPLVQAQLGVECLPTFLSQFPVARNMVLGFRASRREPVLMLLNQQPHQMPLAFLLQVRLRPVVIRP